jgi:cytochrome c biogenesis protein CcdA
MDLAMTTWLGLGFGLGIVHAFDADHVMALSVFATNERSRARAVVAGLRWALGHGAAVLLAGIGLLLLGRSLPPAASLWAERGVGVAMIGLGLYVWLDLWRHRPHLHFHVHEGLEPHAHWHVHEPGAHHARRGSHASAHRHRHAPLMVGALHGLAGSAPLLAVIAASTRSAAIGIGYLLCFAIGVALATAVVSGLLGHLAERWSRTAHAHDGGHRPSALSVLRALCASGSIFVGAWFVALA